LFLFLILSNLPFDVFTLGSSSVSRAPSNWSAPRLNLWRVAHGHHCLCIDGLDRHHNDSPLHIYTSRHGLICVSESAIQFIEQDIWRTKRHPPFPAFLVDEIGKRLDVKGRVLCAILIVPLRVSVSLCVIPDVELIIPLENLVFQDGITTHDCHIISLLSRVHLIKYNREKSFQFFAILRTLYIWIPPFF